MQKSQFVNFVVCCFCFYVVFLFFLSLTVLIHAVRYCGCRIKVPSVENPQLTKSVSLSKPGVGQKVATHVSPTERIFSKS